MGLRLQKFCCCCTLKTGTLVVGTAGWIFTFIELFCLVGPLADKSTNKSYDDDILLDRDTEKLVHSIEKAQHKHLFYQIGLGVVSLVICILLVIGVYKKDKRYMLPWLVLKCFEGIMTILGTIFIFILACAVEELRVLFFIFTLLLILLSGIVWYAWLCVYSHYRELEGIPNDGIPPVMYSQTSAPPPSYQDVEKSKLGLA